MNRRQLDPADREALDLLRQGRAESQRLRAAHGWEHEDASPWATREAMADGGLRRYLFTAPARWRRWSCPTPTPRTWPTGSGPA